MARLGLFAGILFLIGLYAVIAERVPLFERSTLGGRRAQITGALLMLPLLGVLITAGISVAFAGESPGLLLILIIVLFFLGGIAGAIVYAIASRPKQPTP